MNLATLALPLAVLSTIAVVLVLAFVLLTRRDKTGGQRTPLKDPQLQSEVRTLLAQGKRKDAVRLIRERTGAGMTEARTMVAELEAQGR